MKILVTGCAGFIGMHTVLRLLDGSHEVLGVDNLNDYYSVELKQARLGRLAPSAGFRFNRLDITDPKATLDLFDSFQPDEVVHLAAQPGMRYSVQNPQAYVSSNVVGFVNILEGCRRSGVSHLIYASSSSVYGRNTALPFSEHHNADHPVSLYAATKKSNELMAHAYSHLFAIPTTGIRLFTVYGPWGRPDMSPSLFARAILDGEPITIFNNGDMRRAFTYIDDAIEGITHLVGNPALPSPEFDPADPDPAISAAPYRLYNVGSRSPVNLVEYISEIEKAIGKQAIKNYLPMEGGDLIANCADTSDLQAKVGFTPATPLSIGVARFIAWFKDYYGYA